MPAPTDPPPAQPSADGTEPVKKKRRRRVAAATCEQCTRRCNKEIPCNHCIARGIADQCVLYVPRWSPSPTRDTAPADRTSPSSSRGTAHAAASDAAVPTRAGQEPQPRPPSPSLARVAAGIAGAAAAEDVAFREEMRARMQRLEGLMLGSAMGTLGHGVPGAGVSGPSIPAGMAGVPGAGAMLPMASTAASASVHPRTLPPCPYKLTQVCAAAGISPDTILRLLKELPDQGKASNIVDQYFKTINPLRYPILESKFWSPMDDLYEKQKTASDNLESLRRLPLVFIVLALGYLTATEDLAGDAQTRKAESLRLYWCSRRATLCTSAIQPESLELALAGLLQAIYPLQGQYRPLVEGWSTLGGAVRTMLAVGLQRDGSMLGLTPVESEYRRRLWSFFKHADKCYALILGRPPALNEPCYICDTKEPSNVDLEHVLPSQPIVSKPLSEPTSSTFLILQRRFTAIEGQICILHQRLADEPTYEEIEALDNRIQEFIDGLPPPFRLEDADESHDQTRKYLPIQRYQLGAEICFARIMLHRPWLLRTVLNDKFLLCRRACFEAAKLDHRLRKTVLKCVYPVRPEFFSHQYIEFNSAVVAGIAAVAEPGAPDAGEYRDILKSFIGRHPIAAGQSPVAQREITIIYALHLRAHQVLNGTPALGLDGARALSAFAGATDAADAAASVAGPAAAAVTAHAGASAATPAPDDEHVSSMLGEDIYTTMVNMGMLSGPSNLGAAAAPRPPALASTPLAPGNVTLLGPSDLDWLGGTPTPTPTPSGLGLGGGGAGGATPGPAAKLDPSTLLQSQFEVAAEPWAPGTGW